MATNRNARFKASRRFDLNIYGHPKELKRQSKERRPRKISEYGTQLLEKQKEGKKRMRSIGNVEVPQEAFLAVLKYDEDK